MSQSTNEQKEANQNDLGKVHVYDYRGQLLENGQDMAFVYVTSWTFAITSQDIKVKDIQSILVKNGSVNGDKIKSFRREIQSKALSPEAKIRRGETVLLFRQL